MKQKIPHRYWYLILPLLLGTLLGSVLLPKLAPQRAGSLAEPPADPSAASLTETYGKLPLLFEANAGQTDEEVKFLARGRGYALFLTPTESVFVLAQKTKNVESKAPAVLRMQLVGANPAPRISPEDNVATKVSYFVGSDPGKWLTEIPTSKRVRYSEVYPGIDVVYYGSQRQLEYDLVAAPGADLSQISLSFTGAEKTEVDEASGDLLLHTPAGILRQHQPSIYQEVDGSRKKVAGHYVKRTDSLVGFEVASYDTTKSLVIDPALVYSTFIGGTNPGQGDTIGGDTVSAIAVDAAGNAYITGNTMSTDFPTTTGAYDTNFGTQSQIAYVTKINASGTALVYSTFIPASSTSIALDANNNVYLTGSGGSRFPGTVGAYQMTQNGTLGNAFVLKLNSAGSGLVFATLVGGTGNPTFSGIRGGDFGFGIKVDTDGNSYITGNTYSHDYPVTAGAFQTTNNANNSLNPKTAFVTKVNPSGTALVYSTYLGGTDLDNGLAIAVDSLGNAYVTGTAGSDFPTTVGAFKTTYPGFGAAFITKVNTTGTALVYSTYMGGSAFGSTSGKAIAIDTAGNAYITGQTFSSNYPTTFGSYRNTYCGGFSDTFVTKLNTDGTALVYSTYLCAPDLSGTPGTDNTDYGFGIAVDSTGSAIVTGFTNSNVFPVTADAYQSTRGGKDDAFLTKLNPAGSALLYSTFLGSTEFDEAFGGVAVDPAGNAYVAGATASSNFPITPGAYQTTYAGGNDVFVSKFNLSSATIPGRLLNISSRMRVLNGDNVLIGGFILTGTLPREVILRATGPSMQSGGTPVPGTLQDPILSLHDASGVEIGANDDWGNAPEPERTEIQFSGLKPSDSREPAILRTLNPGAYTAIVSGKGGTTGIANVEIYDRDPVTTTRVSEPSAVITPSRLSNISTRGFCSVADNSMFGGAIVGGSTGGGARVLIRGIGPSLNLNGTPLAGSMADPQLELFNANGMSIASNDNWKSDHQQEIQDTGLAPTNDAEAAIVADLPAGATTVQLKGANSSTGIALIEVYELPPAAPTESRL